MTLEINKMEEMKRASILLSFAALSLLSACQKWEGTEDAAPMVMEGVRAVVDWGSETKTDPTPLADNVGRNAFEEGDDLVFTSIRRTSSPLALFSYAGITYHYTDSWSRTDGGSALYWTDATDHTFIAYSLPKGTFDWKSTGTGEYIGSLGNPTVSGDVDCSTPQKLKDEDLLLSYSTTLQAQAGTRTPLVTFHHALSSVRVVVTLNNFADTNTSPVSISDMKLHDQPTLFLWDQTGSGVRLLDSEEQAKVNTAWEGDGPAPAYDQRKDILLWSPNPAAQGLTATRVITFYGITTPHTSSTQLSFRVASPYSGTQSYTATVNAAFEAGYNTTINITVTYAQ